MSETRLQLEASLNDLAAYLDDLEKDIPLTVLQAWHQTFTAKFQTRPLRTWDEITSRYRT